MITEYSYCIGCPIMSYCDKKDVVYCVNQIMAKDINKEILKRVRIYAKV